ncbi:tRNA pseudouridine(55) synthase TruB [Pikeienuella piscinae]|uniref:tRNA pseudouridine synthase B n=1 Tax=Pikeienuella piscinae TaxID=2748098 RepID=A0A7L5C0A7_9RHOB|nr:tRNA pseudouridine(55) synthase TruB [Pikeienuella piscinae]QIE56813.1 tRNA pseudouridine(55) synthase TruB [Pikeienuella piscinae]
MARRKRGTPVDGWLIVDKPEGVTSTQVVGRARWAFNAAKAGHAGTLDPLATGLLAVAFGEATKTVPYAQHGLKTYRFTARWGEATTTDDREGEICERSDRRPDRAAIEAVLAGFIGEIMQRPPIFSAIKVDGARAYDLARRGDDVTLAARPIHVERLTLLETPNPDTAIFEMVCGKGGYVRSMARDLGGSLGTCAHVTALRRLASGGFTLDGAAAFADLETFRDDAGANARLLPVSAGLSGLRRVEVDATTAQRIGAGDTAAAPYLDAPAYWVSLAGAPVAILGAENGVARIRRVFRFA